MAVPFRRKWLSLLVPVPIALAWSPVAGQDAAGRRLSFDISQRVSADTNRDLSVENRDGSVVATTALDFGLSSASATRLFALSLGGLLRDDFGGPDGLELDGPRAGLDYAVIGANSRLSFSADYRRSDITYLDPVDLIQLENGEILVPDDFGDLQGSGTRQDLTVSARAAWGESGPFGLTLAVNREDAVYSGVSNDALQDRTSIGSALTARFDIRPALSAFASVNYERTEEGDGTAENLEAGVDLSLERPTAVYSVGIGLGELQQDAARVTLSGGIARSFRNDGQIALDLDLTRTRTDDLVVEGTLSLGVSPFRTARLTTAARRTLIDDPDQNQVVITALDASYAQNLTRVTSATMGLSLVQRTDLSDDVTDTNARISASLQRQLTPDWDLSAGLSHTLSRQDNGTATSETVFFQLERSFLTKF